MLAGRWGSIGAGDPETTALKSLSIARSEKTIYFRLDLLRGSVIII